MPCRPRLYARSQVGVYRQVVAYYATAQIIYSLSVGVYVDHARTCLAHTLRMCPPVSLCSSKPRRLCADGGAYCYGGIFVDL